MKSRQLFPSHNIIADQDASRLINPAITHKITLMRHNATNNRNGASYNSTTACNLRLDGRKLEKDT